jgi:hypothetical protein
MVVCLLLEPRQMGQAMMIREHKFLLTTTILSSLFAASACKVFPLVTPKKYALRSNQCIARTRELLIQR